MLSGAGLISVREEILVIGRRVFGSDSAAIITPFDMTNVFDMRIHKILAISRD